MKSKLRNIAIVVTALTVVLSLAIPAVGLPKAANSAAKTGTNAAASSAGSNASAQAVANLRNRIENVLRARKARFDAAAANLVKRQARVTVLVDKVEALGGDVAQVRTMLQESTRLMTQAKTQEQACIDAIKAVPDAANRATAFRAARAKSRESVELMKQSRTQLRNATRELSRIAETLAPAEG